MRLCRSKKLATLQKFVKRKLIAIIFFLLIIIITCIGCDNNSLFNIDYTFDYSFQCEGTEPEIKDDNNVTTVSCSSDSIVTLNYKTEGKQYLPDSFYVVTCQMPNNESNSNICMTTNDYNKGSVKSYVDEDSNQIKRVVKSDEDGIVDFNIELGSDKCYFTGDTSVEIISIDKVNDDNNYSLLESENDSVRMVFRSEDLDKCSKTSDELQEWLNYLEAIRSDIKYFSGDVEPYEGHTDYICTETFDYYGLAGNPIYINNQFVVEDLNSITISEEPFECTLLWKYIHEMSHTFDGFDSDNINGNWDFDSEFFATLKAVYALNINGYGMEKYDPDKEDIFSFFEKSNTLKNGIYSSDGLLYTLCKVLSRYDGENMWSIIHETMMDCEKAKRNSQNKNERFAVFWDNLNSKLGCSVEELLTEKELKAIKSKYVSHV